MNWKISIERLTILTPHETVMLRDLPVGHALHRSNRDLKEDVLSGSRPLSDAVDEFERELIVKALQRTGFNQTKAASLLGNQPANSQISHRKAEDQRSKRSDDRSEIST